MAIEDLTTLAALIRRERHALLAEWRQDVRKLPVAQNLDTPTLNDHLPDLLEELARELESSCDETLIDVGLKENPIIHGIQRLRVGFDVEEVVAEYNALRSAIQNLAERNCLSLHGKTNHIVNRVIDGAIGLALKTYATQKAVEVQQRREEHLSFVAHDLRSPLSSVLMAARLLEATLPPEVKTEQASTLLETLRRNVKRMDALIFKVVQEEANLNADADGKLERREVNLRAFVEGLVGDFHPLAEISQTRLINDVPAELAVLADASRLTLIFQNLISNAIKYSPHGEVTIAAREIEEGSFVECLVSDNGAGIPVERLEKIFEKLESDPERNDGIGLGLAIVKQFVEAHGGQVTVTSKLGQGSTFRFTLPQGKPKRISHNKHPASQF
ncbi:MAG: HAMP domain-containing histidine kinase [Acidobacteriota bacterium]|nr:HAMP domain-containing histidine kinase [Acidobacteriota bacterium]